MNTNELKANAKGKVRVSKDTIAKLNKVNPLVAETLKALAERYEIKSFYVKNRPQGQALYAGEGYRYTFVYGDMARQVEMGADHNVGAAGVSDAILAQICPPTGTFVFEVGYMGGFFLTLYNIVEKGLPAPVQS
jgi:hypothetical protein